MIITDKQNACRKDHEELHRQGKKEASVRPWEGKGRSVDRLFFKKINHRIADFWKA